MMLPVDKFQHNESLCGDCDADPAIMQRKQLRGTQPARRAQLLDLLPAWRGGPPHRIKRFSRICARGYWLREAGWTADGPSYEIPLRFADEAGEHTRILHSI